MTTGKISIHALREEGDTTHEEGTSDETHFYPRPPRGGRHNSFTQNALQADISIHALREEGDSLGRVDSRGNTISIHALREEGDAADGGYQLFQIGFLSTPSARRATLTAISVRAMMSFISIHALREEGDYRRNTQPGASCPFLSTPSARRATTTRKIYQQLRDISIHALREEGDVSVVMQFSLVSQFLSTPAASRATPGSFAYVAQYVFLSTPSARRATARAHEACTHAKNFYPRPPRGGRLRTRKTGNRQQVFLSTPSARRATA